MDAIHTEEREGCTLSIYPDLDPTNPIKEWDHAGTLYSWTRGFRADSDYDLSEILELRTRRDRLAEEIRSAREHGRDPQRQLSELADVNEDLECVDDPDLVVIVPLRFSDNGAMGAQLYECEPDDANAAWAVTAKEIASEWFPTDPSKGGPGAGEDGARKYCKGFVSEIDAWLRGEVYGFVVTDPDGDEVESCWGFIDDNVWSGDSEKSHCLAEGRSALDGAVKANRREVAERERLAGYVETVNPPTN